MLKIYGVKMQKKKKMCVIFLVMLIVLIVYIFANAFAIYNYGNIDEKQKSDVAIILGAATDTNGVSPVFAERINHGIWLYNNGYVDYLLFTGGKGEGAKVSDAYKAKEYAMLKGVPEDIIFLEEQSKITQENLKYSIEIMEDNGLNTCIIVSDPLHMKRDMLMAKDYGLNAFSSPTVTTRYRTWKTKLPFLLREEFFYIGYKIYRLF